MKGNSIKEYLTGLKINFEIHEHPAVCTVEEAEKYSKGRKFLPCKNLFIKDRKSKSFYLIILPAKYKLNIEELENKLNNKLKFANEDDLHQILNVETGAIGPYSLINDIEKKVNIVIKQEVLETERLGFPPNITTETLEISRKDFNSYLKSLRKEIIIF